MNYFDRFESLCEIAREDSSRDGTVHYTFLIPRKKKKWCKLHGLCDE